MKLDVGHWAGKLDVVSTFIPGNKSGHVTNPLLYDPNAPNKPPGYGGAPKALPYKFWVRHVTAGSSSLGFLTQGTVGGNWACIQYLIPRGDNFTVYKLIPDWARCYHVGNAEWRGITNNELARQSKGVEIENLANWKQEIDTAQYIKFALIYCYDTALDKMQDYNVLDHSTIARPHGRRSDPQAGLFREVIFWDFVQQIREAWPWGDKPALWHGGSER